MAIPEHWGRCQTVPVVIAKADITPTGRLKGHANAYPVTIDGVSYAAGTCQFLGFAGRLDKADGKYHGHHGFKSPAPADCLPLAFSGVPHFTGTEQGEG